MTFKLGWLGVVASCAGVFLLVGCGTGSPAGSTTKPGAPSNLDGNWIVTPVGSTPSIYGMVLTLTVTGDSVTGVAALQVPCSSTSPLVSDLYETNTMLSGTIASDGSFMLQTSGTGSLSLSITLQGSTPTAAGTAWTGSYSYSGTLNTFSNCPVSVSESSSITVTPMPLLAGTFVSTGQFRQSYVYTPASVSISLQQGVTSTLGLPFYEGLTGSIAVQGSSCLTSGAVTYSTGLAGGYLGGTDLQLVFLMNDGSELLFEGSVSATDASQFTGSLNTVSLGTCGAGVYFVPLSDPTLVTGNVFTRK